MKAAVIVACGGSGQRFGGGLRKQYLPVAGQTVLEHTLDRFEAHPQVGPIVLVLPKEGRPAELLAGLGRKYSKLIRVAEGGADRQSSVSRGLAALLEAGPAGAFADPGLPGPAPAPALEACAPSSAGAAGFRLPWRGPVLVQDGVRPCAGEALISRVIEGALRWGACVPAIQARDTLKRADGEGWITGTVERSGLWQVQTPQGFDIGLLAEAYRAAEEAGFRATDDAGLVEALGRPARLVPGSPLNIKLTYEEDLPLIEAILRGRVV